MMILKKERSGHSELERDAIKRTLVKLTLRVNPVFAQCYAESCFRAVVTYLGRHVTGNWDASPRLFVLPAGQVEARRGSGSRPFILKMVLKRIHCGFPSFRVIHSYISSYIILSNYKDGTTNVDNDNKIIC